MWAFTYPRCTESAIKTKSSNFFGLENIFARCCSSTLQLNSRGPYMVKFTLQNSVWLALISGLLLVERIKKSYDLAEICKLKMIRMEKRCMTLGTRLVLLNGSKKHQLPFILDPREIF